MRMLQGDVIVFISCPSVKKVASKRMWQVMWILKTDLSAAWGIIMCYIFHTGSLTVLGQTTHNVSLVSNLGVQILILWGPTSHSHSVKKRVSNSCRVVCLLVTNPAGKYICTRARVLWLLLQKNSILHWGLLSILSLCFLTHFWLMNFNVNPYLL